MGSLLVACAAIVGLDGSGDLDGGPTTTAEGGGGGGGGDGGATVDGAPLLDWTPVALLEATATACPAGASGAPTPVLENPRPSGPCICTCGDAPNACLDEASYDLTFRTGWSNCNDGNGSYKASAKCAPVVGATTGFNGAGGVVPKPSSIACPATVAPPAATSDASWKICALAPTDGPPCVAHAGAVACPAAFSKAHTVVPASAATDVKGCAPCACKTRATSCTDVALTLFSQSDCGGTSTGKITVTGGCNGYSASANASGARFSATPSPAGCAVSGSAPNMTIATTEQQTICCR